MCMQCGCTKEVRSSSYHARTCPPREQVRPRCPTAVDRVGGGDGLGRRPPSAAGGSSTIRARSATSSRTPPLSAAPPSKDRPPPAFSAPHRCLCGWPRASPRPTRALLAVRLQIGGVPYHPLRVPRARAGRRPRRRRRRRLNEMTSARRHPQLLPPRGSGRGPAFSCPAAPRRYLQLEYLYGTGDGQLGGRRTGDGRCSGAVGGVVESAASARRVARVMVYVHVGRCLKSGSALFFAAAVRRTNGLLIHVFVATRPPHTPDLRTTSGVPHVLQP